MLWEAWTLAKAYRRTPADLYGVSDEVAAYCFNRAVHHFGSALEHELQRVVKGMKNEKLAAARQERTMASWLGTEVHYRDPASGAAPSEKSDSVPMDASGPVSL